MQPNFASYPLAFFVVAIFEAIFRIRNRWSLGQVTPSEAQKMLTFKPSEIDAAVEAGK